MQLSKHFTLEEFLQSDTARQRGIVNSATTEAVENLQRLVDNLLEPLRNVYGEPLYINSGYRCPELNRAVGGVPTSQHTKGEAADVRCDSPFDLLDVLKTARLEFDQAILYPTFLHLSYRAGNNRNQIIIKK